MLVLRRMNTFRRCVVEVPCLFSFNVQYVYPSVRPSVKRVNCDKLTSPDFVINRFFMKLFKTSSIDTVKHCQEYFGFVLPSVLAKRMQKFEVKFGLYLSSE